jgi:SynChlorMet cassette protein ScmD
MDRPLANKSIVLREELDDWAILFDPDTGATYILNPVSVFIWKRLDGKHTAIDIQNELLQVFRNVPENAEIFIQKFLKELIEEGYAGFIVS